MVAQSALNLAIAKALEGVRAQMGAGSIADNGRGGFCLARPSSSLCLLGVTHTNEIEWWMESPDWKTGCIGSDVIQEWLDAPSKAAQFNDSNFAGVIQSVAETGKRALLAYEMDVGAALYGLTAAEARIESRSRQSRLRSEAGTAWERGDYRTLKGIYSEMSGELSPVEAKRLQIAERKLAQAG